MFFVLRFRTHFISRTLDHVTTMRERFHRIDHVTTALKRLCIVSRKKRNTLQICTSTRKRNDLYAEREDNKRQKKNLLTTLRWRQKDWQMSVKLNIYYWQSINLRSTVINWTSIVKSISYFIDCLFDIAHSYQKELENHTKDLDAMFSNQMSIFKSNVFRSNVNFIIFIQYASLFTKSIQIIVEKVSILSLINAIIITREDLSLHENFDLISLRWKR